MIVSWVASARLSSPPAALAHDEHAVAHPEDLGSSDEIIRIATPDRRAG
jgi:hypothetical protein